VGRYNDLTDIFYHISGASRKAMEASSAAPPPTAETEAANAESSATERQTDGKRGEATSSAPCQQKKQKQHQENQEQINRCAILLAQLKNLEEKQWHYPSQTDGEQQKKENTETEIS